MLWFVGPYSPFTGARALPKVDDVGVLGVEIGQVVLVQLRRPVGAGLPHDLRVEAGLSASMAVARTQPEVETPASTTVSTPAACSVAPARCRRTPRRTA